VATVGIGTSRPSREPAHLLHLLCDKLEDFDAGFGVEVMALMAHETAVLPLTQKAFDDALARGLETSRLIDRLATRLGSANVTRLEALASHLPERACRERPVMAPAPSVIVPWKGAERRPSRPIKLLSQPMPIDAIAEAPDGPPLSFVWRKQTHKVVSAEGPERVAPEWWLRSVDQDIRDYFRVEDDKGRRFWIYREGFYPPADHPKAKELQPDWYIHGFFA
jgi:protein ImuB